MNTKNNGVGDTYEKDIEKYLVVNNIVDSQKFKLLRNPWVSNTIYDFIRSI